MLSPSDVTAVIVTRGDVPLDPVVDSLIFDNVIIWNNSAHDEMTYGRYLAAMTADTEIIYSQDDDIIHSPENQQAIVNAYEPGCIVGCMWEDWSAGAKKQGIPRGYDDLVFPGSGSISRRDLWTDALDRYLTVYEHDNFFRLWSDTIIGVITPSLQLDLRFEPLEWATNLKRMADLDDAVALKTEAIRRAREVRDAR